MSALPSIQQRITWYLLYITLAWGLTVSAVLWATVQFGVSSMMDSALQESAEVLFGLLVTHDEDLPAHEGGSLPAPVHDESLVWQLVNLDQTVHLRSHKAPARALHPLWRSGLSDAGPEWRVYGIPMAASGRMLYVAQRSTERRLATLNGAAVTACGTLLVGALFVFFLRRKIGEELAQLAQLTDNVLQFEPLQAQAQLPPVTREELRPIHRAISDLAQRLGRHVANERAFTAHAAHALRTPLAGMDAQLAMALRECTPALRPRLQRSRDAANRLTRVVTALLTLFRSGSALRLQQIDLAAMVERLPLELLDISVPEPAPILADQDLLAAALINLLDNALRYGAHKVTIRARIYRRSQLILVHDDGPGIEPARRGALQAALRAQDYESGKMGLGLMLAAMVARAHGGQLRLLPASSGCAVVLRLQRPD